MNIGTRLRRSSIAAVLGLAAMASFPAGFGQVATLAVRPGGVSARSTGRPKPRRDSEREIRAVLKRRRKNMRRLATWQGMRDGC